MELQDLAAGICKLNHLFCDSPLAFARGREGSAAERFRRPGEGTQRRLTPAAQTGEREAPDNLHRDLSESECPPAFTIQRCASLGSQERNDDEASSSRRHVQRGHAVASRARQSPGRVPVDLQPRQPGRVARQHDQPPRQHDRVARLGKGLDRPPTARWQRRPPAERRSLPRLRAVCRGQARLRLR